MIAFRGPGVVTGEGGSDSTSTRAVFLDRDGVINEDLGYVHTPRDTRWVPGIFQFCRAARAAGYSIVVVTNQSGIARGLYSLEEFVAYTSWIHEQFALRSADLLATWYCPHPPGVELTGCECRKPKPGLLLAAADRHRLDLSASILIGDRQSDIEAGERAGLRATFLLPRTGFAQIARHLRLDLAKAAG